MCGCGGLACIQMPVVEIGQALRDHYGVPVNCSSGFRCYEWNRVPVSEGGPGSNDRSQHPLGTAADYQVEGVEPEDVYNWLELNAAELGVGGLGLYDWGVHVDTRDGTARW